MGSIGTHDALCRDLAKQAKVVVVSVEYRLAPEHKFPAGLEDCYAALQWVSKNAKQLNVDPNKLAIGGGSYSHVVVLFGDRVLCLVCCNK